MNPIKATEHPLFATSIFSMKLPGYGIFNQQFTNFIYELEEKYPEGNKRSNYGGWHSPSLNFQEEIVEMFCGKLDPILINLGNNLGWDMKNYFLGFNEVWSIINKKGDFNISHRHGNSILSLAYYVKFPKGGGDIYFVDPRVAGIPRKPLMKENDNELLGKTHSIDKMIMEPSEGTLILFPGWLEHGVYPSESDEDRIVISANINFWPVSEKNNKGIIHNANLYT